MKSPLATEYAPTMGANGEHQNVQFICDAFEGECGTQGDYRNANGVHLE